MSIDGFEVVDMPASTARCKYAAVFDAAAGCEDGKCVMKRYATDQDARKAADNMSNALNRWKRRIDAWKGLEVVKRGETVFVVKEGQR